jgi:hypothetical protein
MWGWHKRGALLSVLASLAVVPQPAWAQDPAPGVDLSAAGAPIEQRFDFEATEARARGYDFRRFRDQSWSIKWDLLAITAGITAVGVTRWDWGSSGFHTVSEGWFDKDTHNGGMDKIGHAWSAYVLADYLTWRIRNSFADAAGADITGAALSLGFMTFIEISDGLSEGYGFSYQDMIADVAGVGFSLLRNRVPGLAEKLDFRMEYIPSGDGSPWDFATDYMGQKYVLALKPAGFDALRDTPLRFFELHGGYYARGFTDPNHAARERTLYVGIGLNVAEIYDAVTRHDNSLVSRGIKGGLHYVQVPYTYVPLEQDF